MLAGHRKGGPSVAQTAGAENHHPRSVDAHLRHAQRSAAGHGRTRTRSAIARWPRRSRRSPSARWSSSRAAAGRIATLGIDTLGRIIEVVSGEPYEQFLQRADLLAAGHDRHHVLSRARGSAAASPRSTTSRRASWSPPASSCSGPAENARYPIPAGGLYSTGADLARLYQMMLCGGQYPGQAHPVGKGGAGDDFACRRAS